MATAGRVAGAPPPEEIPGGQRLAGQIGRTESRSSKPSPSGRRRLMSKLIGFVLISCTPTSKVSSA